MPVSDKRNGGQRPCRAPRPGLDLRGRGDHAQVSPEETSPGAGGRKGPGRQRRPGARGECAGHGGPPPSVSAPGTADAGNPSLPSPAPQCRPRRVQGLGPVPSSSASSPGPLDGTSSCQRSRPGGDCLHPILQSGGYGSLEGRVPSPSCPAVTHLFCPGRGAQATGTVPAAGHPGDPQEDAVASAGSLRAWRPTNLEQTMHRHADLGEGRR